LGGQPWQYAIFKGAFPIGYVLGTVLLLKLPKIPTVMYVGLLGGGLSFVLLFFVQSIQFALLCELMGGLLFPLFNAQSATIFQQEAPRDRLTQLSAVRLFIFRVSMPVGILFASSAFFEISTRSMYLIIGLLIVVPATLFLINSVNHSNKSYISIKDK
ncbi:MFS transporter, partial [Viridibacillus sp. NPDC093762]